MAENFSMIDACLSTFILGSPVPQSPPQSKSRFERKRPTAARRRRGGSTHENGAEGLASASKKHSKSRNGCVTCRRKRFKCDEEKPACQQCLKQNVQCGGYEKDFIWKPFKELVTSTNKQQKHAKAVSAVIVPSTSTSLQEEHKERDDSTSPTQQSIATSPDNSTDDGTSMVSHIPDAALDKASEYKDPVHIYGVVDVAVSHLASPTSVSLHHGESSLTFGNNDPISIDRFDIFGNESMVFTEDSLFNGEDIPSLGAEQHNGVEYIVGESFCGHMKSSSTERAMNPNTSLRLTSHEPYSCLMTPLYKQPSVAQESPGNLAARFDRFTCRILSVKDGPNENPWRTLLWPMVGSSQALYHAIFSISAFHLSYDSPPIKAVGHQHKNASVHNLIKEISAGTTTLYTAIATTLVLTFAESWDKHTSSGADHIKGARSMIKTALQHHRQKPQTGVVLAQLKFLCTTWVYLDVVARLTSADDDESDDYDRISEIYCLSDNEHDGLDINSGLPIDTQVDPLMGCAYKLFPLIGRVANLVHRARRAESSSAPIVSRGIDLKLQLEAWEPPAFIEPPEDLTSNVQHSVQTAEAYRWATLLHLQQAVPEIPFGLSSSQIARKVLIYLATVPLVSRFVIVHIYPLMVAGCEAVSKDERQWVKERWNAMALRMRIGLIQKCVVITEEVWHRKDKHDAQSLRNRALVSTAGTRGTSQIPPACTSRTPNGGNFFMDRRNAIVDEDQSWTGKYQKYLSQSRQQEQLRPSRSLEISRRVLKDLSKEGVNRVYTSKGEPHWLGVVEDWGWKVLLG